MNKNSRMYNKKYNLFSFLLVIASMIMSIGYATVNSVTMEISGIANADILNDVYIASANVLSYNDNLPAATINMFHKTVLNSSVILESNNPDSNISIKITICNTTDDTYKFKGVEYMFGEYTYSNENITYYLTGLNEGDILEKGESITFDITFHYKDYVLAENNLLNSYLNFNFEKLNVYTIAYNGIINNNYPTSVYEGSNLDILFTEVIPKKIAVTNVENYSYIDGLLSIQNVLGNVIIQNIENIDFVIIGDGNIVEVRLDSIDTYNPINIRDLFELTLTGKNLTSKKISKIDITYTYASKTGSSQSMDSTLTIGSNTYTNYISLSGKYYGDVTTTFDNLNIDSNSVFTIGHSVNKITNAKIDISNIVLRAYMS